ncbi:MAG: 3-hydroxyacyl-ACP dehydratase FabZ family protein [Phycisphaerales bacterium]
MIDPILDRLPHREPFRFVSHVTRLQPGESVGGVWSITGQEAFFAGHFPEEPIVPGVLIAEAMAQLAGLVEDGGLDRVPARLARLDVKFLVAVRPPATIQLSARYLRRLDGLWMFWAEADVAGVRVAEGSIVLAAARERV